MLNHCKPANTASGFRIAISVLRHLQCSKPFTKEMHMKLAEFHGRLLLRPCKNLHHVVGVASPAFTREPFTSKNPAFV
ncbi:hypothetical protein BS50DRAFT_572195 [Corynespora cassiicola Philippines]|uniref:Uncharacterized protein n=1 Tax=Corynespora cassiicola Philippines TaxID=1448308 RepID=A0A2T2NUF1_CORCC|nr:hypothetical protein BS50DRAFT_572195 [Corynespora cassiicola Philippines]